MICRTWALLAGLATLSACQAAGPSAGYGGIAPHDTTPPVPARVAALLPLTGANAALGQALLRAAQLALSGPGSPMLDVRDTGGTAQGAAAAAGAALAAGDTVMIGPLTGPETSAVTPIAGAAGTPVLAFTSDPARAQPGVWILGLTPGQQVRRLVAAAQATGKTRLAALLPRTAFGDALSQAYTDAAAADGLPAPQIVRYTPGEAVAGLQSLAGDTHRHAAGPEGEPTPPLPFDTLLLAEATPHLQQLAGELARAHITPPDIRVMGPALWAGEAPRLPALAGAWYAAPEPALRADFERRYLGRFGSKPPAFADLAYDAAALIRVLAGSAGVSTATLTRSEGFAGVDGVFALQPDGHVRRALALFEVGAGESQLVQPSPTRIAAGM